jgi:hypothetical protein
MDDSLCCSYTCRTHESQVLLAKVLKTKERVALRVIFEGCGPTVRRVLRYGTLELRSRPSSVEQVMSNCSLLRSACLNKEPVVPCVPAGAAIIDSAQDPATCVHLGDQHIVS